MHQAVNWQRVKEASIGSRPPNTIFLHRNNSFNDVNNVIVNITFIQNSRA